MDSETYRTTRSAWNRIWREEGSLERELETLEYARARQARALYLPQLPSDGLLLEAGCGVGAQLVHLGRLGYRTIGVDYAENALSQLRASFPEHSVTAGDVHRLPFVCGRFAGYLSFGVLEHFDFGPGPALMEANRVLRPGGLLIVAVPYPNLVWRLVRIRGRFVRPGRPSASRYYETTYTLGRMEDEVRRAGFAVLDRHPIGHSFTLWGLGPVFRGPGYYESSPLADRLGDWLRRWAPWIMCFECLIIARKVPIP
jgi:SAM-dependent methyltransferase